MALGVPYNNIYSLDLPFYESGKVNKNPLSKKDIDIVKGIIMKVRP
jgi:glucosamine-6-phosphate deaminase